MSAKLSLLEAAAALARSDGVTALGVEKVIQKAGVSKGAFFYHFATKEEMVRALLDHVSQQCMQEVDNAVAQGARFTDAFVDMILEQVRDNGALIAVLVASVSLDPGLKVLLTERMTHIRNRMIEEDGMPPERADLLRVALDGMMIGTVLYDNATNVARLRHVVEPLKRLFFDEEAR